MSLGENGGPTWSSYAAMMAERFTPRGVALMAYQRRLALEQAEAARRKAEKQ